MTAFFSPTHGVNRTL